MDKKLNTISHTFFSGELSTIDIMVLKIHLLNIHPKDVIFCTDNNSCFIIDFKYDDCVASDYINKKLIPILPDKYIDFSPMIAAEMTNYEIILDDIKKYIETSKKLKKVIKFYKSNKKNKCIEEANNKLKIAMKKGVDYDYIKGTYV
ncbi:hypothetical protein DpV83gp087 [Deerpox virus W-848-83]|uniref:Uncharacterized protein n=1 Tax=Deerpox virus (strain Mule deer/United States/W-848-83/1983) TaxID=305674 RepID=Q08FR5_DPV83|nr:hypothetical protein DpV83gp087 [Deerpox virus W-848-83]ABI99242.1 hypothetical protein DpV83gp087 [Deerpox virus W-848-83]